MGVDGHAPTRGKHGNHLYHLGQGRCPECLEDLYAVDDGYLCPDCPNLWPLGRVDESDQERTRRGLYGLARDNPEEFQRMADAFNGQTRETLYELLARADAGVPP